MSEMMYLSSMHSHNDSEPPSVFHRRRFTAARVATAILIGLGSLLGCSEADSYQIVQDSEGRTIRLNKSSGEVVVLQGNKLVQLTTPEDEARATAELSRRRDWPVEEIPSLRGIRANLATAWVDGKLHYQFSVAPGSAIEGARTHAASRPVPSLRKFTLRFYDAAGFKRLAIDVPLVTLSASVDDSGKLVSYHANDAVTCTSETYKQVDQWDLSWNFE